MGYPVLILGFSGSGKSASMRDFAADEIALCNVEGKMLPFRTSFSEVLCSDNYEKIIDFMRSTKKKTIVIDDAQYLMANEFMRRSEETGFKKFTDIGKNFWDLVQTVFQLPDDVIVYILSHMETADDGRQKIKTIGKLLDEKITVEGMFTTVLKTVVKDGKYYFATQTDGADTCKSPMGLFPTMYIDNSLKMVDEALRIYYQFAPETACADCGNPVLPAGGKSAAEIVSGTQKAYGKPLCWGCAIKAKKGGGK